MSTAPQTASKNFERRPREVGHAEPATHGRDDVVGHVEVVPHAGLVERKPLEREHQHGYGAAKVQNPVLQSEVEPEVKVEGSRASSLVSLDGAVPGLQEGGARLRAGAARRSRVPPPRRSLHG